MLAKNNFVVKRILTIAIAYAESNGGNNSGTITVLHTAYVVM